MTGRLIASAMAVVLALQPPFAEPNVDLWKYGITQGGLLAVVLILIWAYRKDLKAVSERQDDKIVVLVSLVNSNTAAMIRNTEASEAQKDCTQELIAAVQRLEGFNRRQNLDDRRT